MIYLWDFPPEDFEAWRALVGDPEVDSHSAYLTLLAAIQADQERQGHPVRRVRFSVAEMRLWLVTEGLENTPDNRALVVAKAGS